MLTYEQRLELLKKAREAKKNKKASKIAPEPQPTEPIPEVEETNIVFEEEVEPKKVKKTRAKSAPKSSSRTLDIPAPMPDFVDSEPEVEEQIIYKPKEKKKKKIIKRIIMEASSDEEEVEVIEERVKAPKKEKAKKDTIKQEIVVKENPFFNY
jgi:hypothetical protein